MAYDELKNQIQKTQDVEMSTLSSLRSPLPTYPSVPSITSPVASTQLPAATSFYLPTTNCSERNSNKDVTCGFVWIAVLLTTILIWLFIITIKITAH